MTRRRDHEVFWDTPVLALRVCGRRADQIRIEAIAATGDVSTSLYVIHQFKSTFIRSAILLHSLFMRHETLSEVLRRLDHFPIRPREAARARQILAALEEDGAGDREDKLSRLERWIEWEFVEVALDQVEVFDDTRCCLCDDEVIRDENGIYTLGRACNLEHPKPCEIERFWGIRHEELAAIAAARDEGIQEITQAARVARDDPRKVRGRQCWAPLSDAVIAAQSPPGSETQTTNLRDLVPLTRIIGGGRRARHPLKER